MLIGSSEQEGRMSEQRFLTGSREQSFLLPPDMHDWLPMGRGGRPTTLV